MWNRTAANSMHDLCALSTEPMWQSTGHSILTCICDAMGYYNIIPCCHDVRHLQELMVYLDRQRIKADVLLDESGIWHTGCHQQIYSHPI